MKRYDIELRPAAMRDLRKIPRNDLERIAKAIDDLANDPRPIGCLKMKGYEGFYRLRIGDYRIIYDIQEKKLVVLVIRIRQRKDAYR
ncbi:type II toxin-antitoxin system RelE/ParE family toxin, partial [bacterium]|nr:type II toxin-antitoxin system RelE/ParE family toxin [bacterium]